VVDVEELASLVIRARAGHLDAYGEIVRRFQDMAYGYAYSLLGDFHLAEDAAQEAFIEAYIRLAELREPAAFPGWFRRVVFKHCDRITRRKRAHTVPLEEDMLIGTPEPPLTELREQVLEAVRNLPERERETTTLFYINGYSQKEIADFLEVPVTTVQKRLHDSRRKLKERMLGMVEETLKSNAFDERFSQKVIRGLLERPNLLEIENHPVKKVADLIRSALAGYECVEGQEIVDKAVVVFPPGLEDRAYHVDSGRVLRTETTITVLQAMKARKPPIRVFTMGRVFRPDQEDAGHSKVFHQADVLCVGQGVSPTDMKDTLTRVIEAVLGHVELAWEPHCFPRFEDGFEASVRHEGSPVGIAGCGMMSAATLAEAGLDPEHVSGFCCGMGLERLAMLKYGIDDVHALRRPPYLPLT
jgi:RNA polymerase sigma factor (sigma-70 family)